jgi:mannose-1-phosphate guanylyltransferase/mannose-6-phosphate isomerase
LRARANQVSRTNGFPDGAAMTSPARFESLTAAAAWFRAWLLEGALPLWASAGVDPLRGSFVEALSPSGSPQDTPRRSRTQARQVWLFATAAVHGFPGDWLAPASRGFDIFLTRYRRDDGLFVRLADIEGRVLDDTAPLYEQAFSLLAMSALHVADPARQGLLADADAMRARLSVMHNPAGGFREVGEHPFQANAHMHLLEACLAWEDAGAESWRPLSDEIAALALERFIAPETGVLREFFDEDWHPLSDEGGLVEPGHQFEWAWLLDRWGRMRGDAAATSAARRLYLNGQAGIDPVRNVAVNSLWDDLSVRDPVARLWPQTERLKAALILGTDDEALAAAEALRSYLDTPARGAWRDKMLPDGAFVEEAAPATSFYHLMGAILPLLERDGPKA